MMRERLEWLLRGVALVLLGWALWIAFAPRVDIVPASRSTTVDELHRTLPAWSVSSDTLPIHARLDTAPDRLHLAWLAALRRGGGSVTWSGELPALAVELRATGDPRGRVTIAAAAPAGATVALSDDAGLLDSMRVERIGTSISGTGLAGTARVALGAQVARAAPVDSVASRRLLVLARAGWEAKFAIAALEEVGWQVDAVLAVGPGNDVLQGPPAALDTSRYAVVIAMDSVAARQTSAILRFVRSGGGLVLAGEAAALPAFASVCPGAVGSRRSPRALAVTADAPRHALASLALSRLHPEAVLLEEDAGVTIAAARRVGAGRVVQVGWLESWRWRMTGGDESPAAHRDWWAAVISSAAYRPMLPGEPGGAPADPTPLVRTVAALGAPVHAETQRPGLRPGTQHDSLPGWIFVAVVGILLAEWGSRRLRGAS